MATISFTLPAADLATTVEALSTRWGYTPTLEDGSTPNPQTKGEFVRLKIRDWIRGEVRAHRLATAQAAVTVPDVDIA